MRNTLCHLILWWSASSNSVNQNELTHLQSSSEISFWMLSHEFSGSRLQQHGLLLPMALRGVLLWVQQAGAPVAPRWLSHSPFPPVIFLHYFRNLSWLLRCPGCSGCTVMLERTLVDLTQCHKHAKILDSSGFAMTTFMKHFLSSTVPSPYCLPPVL